jgi:hypothetical protein
VGARGGALVDVLTAALAAAALAAAAGWTLSSARSRAAGHDEAPTALATDRDTLASQRFQAALDACRGLPARLIGLADAADAQAAALRDAHKAGRPIGSHRVKPEWRPPWELQRDSPRLPVIAWQLLDRAFEQLAATLDDNSSGSDARANACEQLATAARRVAEQLANDDDARQFSSELARCGFCGKRARDVRKIIAGPTTSICDECVQLCVETLDEDPDSDAD